MLSANRWLFVLAMNPLFFPAAAAQRSGAPIGLEINGGTYVPVTSLGAFGFASAKERVAPTVGAEILYHLRQNRAFGVGVAAAWTWSIENEVRPTSSCTGPCVVSRQRGGRSLVGLVVLAWPVSSPIGLFALTGGAGFKSYENGGAISACDNQYCYDSGYFLGSSTSVAGQLGFTWRPRRDGRLGLRLTDVVSRYRTGHFQHDFLVLLSLRLL
jgi:hypothetical protein